MALSVTPSGERVIIAIIHNLLRRHPSINFLVNKVFTLLIQNFVIMLIPKESSDISFNILSSAMNCQLFPRKLLIFFFLAFILILMVDYLQQIDEEAEGEASEVGNNSSQDAGIIRPVVQSKKHGIDPFKSEESDPSKSDAMRKFLNSLTNITHNLNGHVLAFSCKLILFACTSIVYHIFCSGGIMW